MTLILRGFSSASRQCVNLLLDMPCSARLACGASRCTVIAQGNVYARLCSAYAVTLIQHVGTCMCAALCRAPGACIHLTTRRVAVQLKDLGQPPDELLKQMNVGGGGDGKPPSLPPFLASGPPPGCPMQ